MYPWFELTAMETLVCVVESGSSLRRQRGR